MTQSKTKIEKLFDTDNKSTYIISEIGINHNGSLKTALELIKASKEAGVDAVKFQKRNLKKIYSDGILNNPNNAEWNFDYLIPLLKEIELSKQDYKVIKKTCDELSLDLIITPFDEDSAEFVHKLGVVAYKISSSDMTNFNLIKKCASYNLPLIISTGMWDKKDIQKCVNFYKNNNINYALLLTNSTYPAPYESTHLKFIEELKKMSNIVGYSGHERGIFIPVAAVALGAKIIEKHITFSRNDYIKVGNKLRQQQKGPDHKASLLPEEFTEMVNNIRNLEKSLQRDKDINQAEKLNREAFAKSATAKHFLKKGHILTESDIIFRAPGKGIFPHEINEYIKKKLTKDVLKDKYISKNDFKNNLSTKGWEKFNFSQKWGLKCRFHDYEKLKQIKPPVLEFHFSDTDLDVSFDEGNNESELIVHAPEIVDRKLINFCSNDPEIVNMSIKTIQKTIDKATKLGKKWTKAKTKLVIHLGGMQLNKSTNKNIYTECLNNAINNFSKLKYSPDDIEILPENLPSRPWYLNGEWYQYGFTRAEDMLKFCKHFNLGMTFDICHAALYCNNEKESLVDYAKKIRLITKHIHISDAKGTSGEGIQINKGEINFKEVLDVFKNKNFSWVTEIWSGHLHEGIETYKALLKLEKFNEIL
ncbi:MAG: N-acetylneuraminate synthase family protein [Patescibacteria group bacterium]|nr:N-acetylneuraminate synthase family protein [Patescibacteria group bacterium]